MISAMGIITLTTIVLADETSISFTFDTDGSVDIDGNPGTDAYSIYTENLDTDRYIINSYGADFDSALTRCRWQQRI